MANGECHSCFNKRMHDNFKLSAELKLHGFNVSPKEVSDLLVLRRTLYELQGIEIKDIHWLVKDLLNDLGRPRGRRYYFSGCDCMGHSKDCSRHGTKGCRRG